MTEGIAVALISGGFGIVTAVITTAGLIISRKARDAAREAARTAREAVGKVEVVHGQAMENFGISQANHETLARVVENTNGNVTRLQEAWAAEARRRETVAWRAAFEAGRRAEITKNRRATDPVALPELEPVNDEEPKE